VGNLQELQVAIADKLTGLARRTYPDLPILTMAEKFLRYSFKGEEKIIEITHAAQGKTPDDLFKDVSVSQAELRDNSAAVGRALAAFHQVFMDYGSPTDVSLWKTILHGDFHQMNMFVKKFEGRGESSGEDYNFYRVYFIDNETMIHSIRGKQALLLDVLRFCVQRLTGSKGYMYESACSSHDCQPRYHAMVGGFIHGYINGYERDRQAMISKYITKELVQRLEYLKTIISTRLFSAAPPDLKNMAAAVVLRGALRTQIMKWRSPSIDAEEDMFLRSCVKMQQMGMVDENVQRQAIEKINALIGVIVNAVSIDEGAPRDP